MNTQTNIAENQEKFIIHVDPQIAKIVSPFDRKELAATYLQMFSGFAWRNWTNKYSLGRAWQTALAQCGAFCDTKNEKNPAAKYLKNVYDAHKKYWSRVIMTHGARDNVINPDDQEIKKLRAHGERMIRESMDKINLILARYNERVEELIATQSKEKAQMHTSAMPQAMAQTAKSVAQPAQQSGAFAMVRDAVKRPNAAIADKPVEVPMAKPAQAKPIEQKMAEQKPVEQKPAHTPIKVREQTPQTVVQHAPKSVAQPVKPSGALPVTQDKVKQHNVVKTETKAEEFAKAEKRMEISAEQRVQMQIEFQKRIQMWQLAQYKQNAA